MLEEKIREIRGLERRLEELQEELQARRDEFEKHYREVMDVILRNTYLLNDVRLTYRLRDGVMHVYFNGEEVLSFDENGVRSFKPGGWIELWDRDVWTMLEEYEIELRVRIQELEEVLGREGMGR